MNQNNIQAYNYVEAENKLTITYQGGTTYDYHPVNPENWAELIAADCLSYSIQRFIRKGTVVGVQRAN